MAGINISIELNDAALESVLNRAVRQGTDMRQPMGEIADEWMDLARHRFADERDPLGVPWAKRRDDSDPGRKVLHLTGALERSIVPDFGADFAQIGVLPSGGPGKYARIHNEGGVIVPRFKKALSFGGRIVSRVVMPKRQFLGFGEGERRSVVEIMGDFLRGLFGSAEGWGGTR